MSEYTIFPSRKASRTYTPRMAGSLGLEDLLAYQLDAESSDTGFYSIPIPKTTKDTNSYSWTRGGIFDIAKEIGYPNLYPSIPANRPFGPSHEFWKKPDANPNSHLIDIAPVDQEGLPYCLPCVMLTDLSHQIGAKINIRDSVFCNTPDLPFRPGWAPSQLDLSVDEFRKTWEGMAEKKALEHSKNTCLARYGKIETDCVVEHMIELRKAFGYPLYNKEPESYNSFTSDFSMLLVYEARALMWNMFLATADNSLVRLRVVLSCTSLDCSESLGDGVPEEACESQCTKDIYLKFIRDTGPDDDDKDPGQVRLEYLLDELNNGRPVASLVDYGVIRDLLDSYSGDPNNIELELPENQPIFSPIKSDHIVLIIGYEFLPDGRFKIIIQDSNSHKGGQHRYGIILPTTKRINEIIGIGYEHWISSSKFSSKIQVIEPSIPIDASLACAECGKTIEPCESTPTPSLPTVTPTPTDGSTPTPSIP